MNQFSSSRRLGAAFALTLAFLVSAQAATWHSDFGTAKLRVAAENKPMLMLFTGSDWCPACKNLNREVFLKPEFGAYADASLILFEADFPRHKPLPASQSRANEALAKSYGIRYFPTVILLDTRVQEVARVQYDGKGAKSFVSTVDNHVRGLAGGRGVSAKSASDKRASTPDTPLFNGAPPVPPPRYSKLVLKGISGTKQRRFALLNNQTLAAGETARVKLADAEVTVRCIEIRDASVVVAVDGQPGEREILLEARR